MDSGDVQFVGAQAVASATPLMLAGIGEVVAERAGVINIGIEGMMLVGALGGFAGALHGGGWAGVALAGAAGMAMAAVFAIATIWLRANQIVMGCAIFLLAAGTAGMLWQMMQPESGELNLPASAAFHEIAVPGLEKIPLLGPIFFHQFLLTYIMAALAIAAWAILKFTRGGLIVRALGESPDACAAAGVRVRLWQTGCVLLAGALAGVAGSYLSIMRTQTFTLDAIGGRGYLVLALVIFGRWNIWGLAAGCTLFGLLDAWQQYMLAGNRPAWMSIYAFQMLPYIATLAALAILSRRNNGPAHLGRPWPER